MIRNVRDQGYWLHMKILLLAKNTRRFYEHSLENPKSLCFSTFRDLERARDKVMEMFNEVEQKLMARQLSLRAYDPTKKL